MVAKKKVAPAQSPTLRQSELRGGVVVEIPGLRLVCELNAHEHYRVRAKRAAEHHAIVESTLRTLGAEPPPLPAVVCITRLAPRSLDAGDNLQSSPKFVRDAVARWLGVDDRDPRVTWHVCQEQSSTYGVRIEVAHVLAWTHAATSARVQQHGVRTAIDVTLNARTASELAGVLARWTAGDAVTLRVGNLALKLHACTGERR